MYPTTNISRALEYILRVMNVTIGSANVIYNFEHVELVLFIDEIIYLVSACGIDGKLSRFSITFLKSMIISAHISQRNYTLLVV